MTNSASVVDECMRYKHGSSLQTGPALVWWANSGGCRALPSPSVVDLLYCQISGAPLHGLHTPSCKAVCAEDCMQWGWGNVIGLMKPSPTSQGFWTVPHTGQKSLCWADSQCWAVLEIVCWHLVLSYSPMEAVEEAVTTVVQVPSCSCRQSTAQDCTRPS